MNKWKVLAIIFIIISILEGLTIYLGINYGINAIEKQNDCAYNVCADYDSYYFDIDNMCYCYRNGEIVYQEYIR